VRPITVICEGAVNRPVASSLRHLDSTGLVEEVVLIVPPDDVPQGLPILDAVVEVWSTDQPGSAATAQRLLDHARTSHLLRIQPFGGLEPDPRALIRLLETSQASGAGIVYGDYVEDTGAGTVNHPLADHQLGSLGDRFDMGPMVLWDLAQLAEITSRSPITPDLSWLAWYELRLALSRTSTIVRLAEPLGTRRALDERASGQAVFDYLTAGRALQVEAERIATNHLARMDARVKPPYREFVSKEPFPVEASVVIPVRNRERTVAEAIHSALCQEAPFPFNVIVVDNHSTDRTSRILAEAARQDERLFHVVPERLDLGIGGCWNEAVFNPACGRYAVQLDSDDLYHGRTTIVAMVAALRDGHCGMAVGSYTTVDMNLDVIPPGLIDHREWSDDNGPNNALRVEGLGAPRAFATELLRQHPFPNVSYGEDYAVALRISREYRVGRIYDSLYHCRRWEDNTDADLPPNVVTRYQVYKDRVRTLEIAARRRVNRLARGETG
jgi:hypothetical protein